MATMATATGLVVVGAIRNAGTGSFSAFGIENVAAICPLGTLETAVASRDIMPTMLISFLVIAALTALLGRVFCGWICPVPLVRKILTNEIDEGQRAVENSAAPSAAAITILENEEKTKSFRAPAGSDAARNYQSGLVVLGITIGSSAICGFPVFCLICPIGLIVATLLALIRLIHFNEPTFDLVIFPLVVVAELMLMKKWCSKWCPAGALLSIFSKFNRSLVPVVDRSLCREESSDIHCQRCRSACSFDVDIKNGSGAGDISDCTKCRECAEACPAQAIRFPWR